MRYRKLNGLIVTVIITTLLSACNLGKQPEPTPDVGLIFTAAAQTVVANFSAQQTQTALAAPTATQPPTTTAIPTFSIPGTAPVGGLPTESVPVGSTPAAPLASPTLAVFASPVVTQELCDNSAYGGQTVPDGTVMKPGEDFKVGFTLINTGTCTWDEGYTLVYQGGTLDGYDIKIKNKSDFVDPGGSILFTINLTASLEPNTYTNCWKMQNDRGSYFGTFVCITIEVKK